MTYADMKHTIKFTCNHCITL